MRPLGLGVSVDSTVDRCGVAAGFFGVGFGVGVTGPGLVLAAYFVFETNGTGVDEGFRLPDLSTESTDPQTQQKTKRTANATNPTTCNSFVRTAIS